MAQQHYYSRVPARMSMFNKTDGFDTFACSKGIDLSFAEDTLGVVDEIKLTAAENAEIRAGRWSQSFVQFNADSGRAVQSLITYLPLDYTSERPGYMVHSLVLSEKERAEMLTDAGASPINTSLFVSDLASFDLLSADSQPDSDLPEPVYAVNPNTCGSLLKEKCHPDTAKRFIYAVTAAICGKLRNLYILQDDAKAADPSYMLDIINSIYSVLPIQLRASLTFATRVNNLTHLPTVKIKGIAASSLSKDIPTAKGASIDLDSGKFTGIRDEDVAANIQSVELLYAMLDDAELQSAFFDFCRHVYDNTKQTSAPSLKMLFELTLLFKVGSGRYNESEILPTDDSVNDFLGLYGTYRDALPKDMRPVMINCIKRYSDAGIEIPKKAFGRVTKLYKDEPAETKNIIMQSTLDLIHTDAMRDKLFVFIKNCYDTEDDEMRDEIVSHLISVFYGGFLQHKLIEFFGEKYTTVSDAVRTELLQKVLLTIRTRDIREDLISFVDTVWQYLETDKKRSVIECYAEQLPEGDELAHELIKHLDTLLPSADELLQITATDLMTSALEAERSEESHPMLALFVPPVGFCAEHMAAWALSGDDDGLFDEYVTLSVDSGTLKERIASLGSIYELASADGDDGGKLCARITSAAATRIDSAHCDTDPDELFSLISALSGSAFDSSIKRDILHPLLAASLIKVFSCSETTVETLVEYKRVYGRLGDTRDFAKLISYLQFKKAFLTADIAAMFASCDGFGEDKAVRAAIGRYAMRDLSTDEDIAAKVRVTLATAYLTTGSVKVGDCYLTLLEELMQKYAESRDDSLEKATVSLINTLLTAISEVYLSADTEDAAKRSLESDDSGIGDMAAKAFVQYGNPAKQYIKKRLSELSLAGTPVETLCTDAFSRAKPQNGIITRVMQLFKK